MCVMSLVTGHYYERFPNPMDFPLDLYSDYKELVRKARLYDEMMEQKDCPDPAKEKWAVEIEKSRREKYGLEPKT